MSTKFERISYLGTISLGLRIFQFSGAPGDELENI